MSTSSQLESLLTAIAADLDCFDLHIETFHDAYIEGQIRAVRELLKSATAAPTATEMEAIAQLLLRLAPHLNEPAKSRQENICQQLTCLAEALRISPVRTQRAKRGGRSSKLSSQLSATSPANPSDAKGNKHLSEDLLRLLESGQASPWIRRASRTGYGFAKAASLLGQPGTLALRPLLRARRSGSSCSFFEAHAHKYFDVIVPAFSSKVTWKNEKWEALLVSPKENEAPITLLYLLFQNDTALYTGALYELEKALQKFYCFFKQPHLSLKPTQQYLFPIRNSLRQLSSTFPSLVGSKQDHTPIVIGQLRLRKPLTIIEELFQPKHTALVDQLASGAATLLHGDLGAEVLYLLPGISDHFSILDSKSSEFGDYVFDLSSLLSSLLGIGHLLRSADPREWIAIGPAKGGNISLAHFHIQNNHTYLGRSLEMIDRLLRGLSPELERSDLGARSRLPVAQKRLLLALSFHFFMAASRTKGHKRSLALFSQGTIFLNFFFNTLCSLGELSLQQIFCLGLRSVPEHLPLARRGP